MLSEYDSAGTVTARVIVVVVLPGAPAVATDEMARENAARLPAAEPSCKVRALSRFTPFEVLTWSCMDTSTTSTSTMRGPVASAAMAAGAASASAGAGAAAGAATATGAGVTGRGGGTFGIVNAWVGTMAALALAAPR